MRGFWLTGTVLFSVLILVVAFENIHAQCSYINFLFYEVGTEISPTFTFFGITFMGIVTGIFICGLFNSLLSKPSEEEEDSDL